MKPLHFRECRPARWFAGLALLAVATAGPRLAAADAAIVLDQAAVDTAPVLISRASAMPPLASRPPFGAELVVEFVVDAQGQPRDVKVVEAKATLASGRIFDEADLATIRRLGDLDGISPNASFKDVIDQITQPFLEPGRAAVLGWRYRPGNKAGAAVATRLRATVSVPGADSLPAPTLRTVRTVPAPTPIEPSTRSPESDRPSAPPGPSDRKSTRLNSSHT